MDLNYIFAKLCCILLNLSCMLYTNLSYWASLICRCENITYYMQCLICHNAGVSKVYWGESSRTLFLRGKEHWSAYLGKHTTLNTILTQLLNKKSRCIITITKTTQKIDEVVLTNNSKWGNFLIQNQKSQEGGKYPVLL